MLRTIRNNLVKTIASRHVAGPGINEALVVCRWAQEHELRSILSPWAFPNESVKSMHDKFLASIEAIHNGNLDSYVSVKLEAIGYDMGIFDDLVDLAKEYKIRIHLDSLAPETAPKMLTFLEKAVLRHNDLGCTLPSRWKRSLSDADHVGELGVAVRIVKGQWKDLGAEKVDARENYVAIAKRLAGKARLVAVATHDLPLAEKALESLSTSNANAEFEQFFSLPLNGQKVATRFGYHYRLYVAYGYPGVPYNIRFTLSRPGIVGWVIADFALNHKKPWSISDTAKSLSSVNKTSGEPAR